MNDVITLERWRTTQSSDRMQYACLLLCSKLWGAAATNQSTWNCRSIYCTLLYTVLYFCCSSTNDVIPLERMFYFVSLCLFIANVINYLFYLFFCFVFENLGNCRNKSAAINFENFVFCFLILKVFFPVNLGFCASRYNIFFLKTLTRAAFTTRTLGIRATSPPGRFVPKKKEKI